MTDARLDRKLLDMNTAPESLPRPLIALWWLRKGNLAPGPEWTVAHEICQEREGDPDYDIVHALAHWIEGDRANADYWYHRAGRVKAETIEDEWHRIAALLQRRTGHQQQGISHD